MLDEIRSLDWVPRSVREKIGRLHKTFESLAKKLGRAPTEDEVAGALQMDRGEFDVLLSQAKGATLLHLEDLGFKEGEERNVLESLIDPRSENPLLSLLSRDVRTKLIEAIEQLPEKERRVITLYYHEELTMKEIGQVLKITESRVCQLHTQAILRLKGKLEHLRDV